MRDDFSIEPVNPTVCVYLKDKLCLEAFSRLIVCVPIRNFKFVERKGIPYFGKERIIVGNKSYLWGSYGVRCQGNKKTGTMKNCVSIDYQVLQTNFNIKIYKGNLHIVGTKSFELLDKLVKLFIEDMNRINHVWSKFFKMRIKDRLKFIKNIIYPLIFDEDKNFREMNDSFWEDYHNARKENYHMRNVIKCLLSFYFQVENEKEYMKKLKILCNMEVGLKSSLSDGKKIIVEEIKILECTYTGNLNKDNILLSKLAQKLRDINIDATFHNQRGKFVRIVTDKGLEDENVKKTSSKLPLHQINIFNSGHVRINSPAKYKITYKVTRIFINIVKRILKHLEDDEDLAERVNERIKENLKTFRLENGY